MDREALTLENLGETEGVELESLAELDGEAPDRSGNANFQFGDPEDLESLDESEAWSENLEADPFIGGLIKNATKVLGTVARGGNVAKLLPHLATQAARVAGGAIAGRPGATIAAQIARRCVREAEQESYESESEDVQESEASDQEALDEMHFYAAQAAEAESEAQADQFLGALAPIIGQIAGPLLGGLFGGDGEQEGDAFLSDGLGEFGGEGESERLDPESDRFLPALAALAPMAIPLVQKGVQAAGNLFRKNRRTRPALRALPTIANRAIQSVARQARMGRQITPQRVAATLAQQTARTLASRNRLGRAIQTNRASAARAQARPHLSNVPLTGIQHRPQLQTPGGRPRRRRLVGFVPVYAAGR